MANAHVLAGKYSPLGYEQVTSLSSAAGLTPPEGARLALIQAQDQDTRWRDDGTNPTTTVGMNLIAGAELSYSGNLAKIKFIEVAASAKLNVSYFA
jgi:hypothetical protein